MPSGRLKFKPTDQMRATVKAMSAYGVPQDSIARVIGCDPKTLRLYFDDEIALGAIEANAQVAQTLFRLATEGTGHASVVAMMFWLKCRTNGAWRDRDPVAQEPLGKKYMIQQAAVTAGEGSDWGDDLNVTARLN